MGYRSEWQMILSGEPEVLSEFLKWCEEMYVSSSAEQTSGMRSQNSSEKSVWWELTDPDAVKDMGDEIRITGSGTKCYEPWDKVIDRIEQHCEDQEIGFAYGRLGGNYEDVDVRNNDLGISIWVERKMEAG